MADILVKLHIFYVVCVIRSTVIHVITGNYEQHFLYSVLFFPQFQKVHIKVTDRMQVRRTETV